MGAGLDDFVQLMNEQEGVYTNLRRSLVEMLDAAKRRDTERLGRLTTELTELRDLAHRLEDRMLGLVRTASQELGIEPASFKLSLLDKEGRYRDRIDKLRGMVSETARLSAQAGGVLSANVNVIEETVKVLESIDARSVGYGSDKPAAARPSKMIDRSA
jgi:Mg2+ and Co2+ transporter CorA